MTQPDPDGAGSQTAPVFVYAYSAAGLLASVSDPLSRVTSFTYDALGRRTKVTLPDPDGGGSLTAPETEYVYDAANRLDSMEDALGNVTQYDYDLYDNPLTVTQPDPDGVGSLTSPVTTYDFDAAGQLLSLTDPLSRTTDYEYDGLGRLKKSTLPDPDGAGSLTRPFTTYSYDAASNLLQTTDPLGNRVVREYDNLYRTVATKQTSGDLPTVAVSTTTQGASTNEVQRVGYSDSYEIYGGTFTLTYSGQTTSSLDWDATASEVLSALEALSNIGSGDVAVTKVDNSSTDQRWRVTFQGSLAGTNVTQITIDTSSISSYDTPSETEATDTQGSSTNEVQVVTLTGTTGGTFRLQFGSERTGTIASNASASTLETALEALTAIDNVSVSGSAGGPYTITFQGAQAGQNVAALLPEASYLTNSDLLTTTRFTYDARGKLLSLTDPVGNVTQWAYDNLGRATSETNELSEVRTFKYDAASNLTERVDRLGRKIEYVYDNLHRNTSEKWYSGATLVRTLSFGFNAAGELTSASDPAASYSYSYDALGRVTSEGQSITGLTPGITYESVYNALSRRTELQAVLGGTDDFQNTYTYDNLSRLTRLQQQDVSGGNAVADKRFDFAYDASGAFTKIDRYADQAAAEHVVSTHYSYDGIGRMTKLLHTEGPTAPGSGWGSDALAGYQYTYDAASRITSIDSYVDGLTSYSHDDTDQLTAADHSGMTDESYTYDANGNRIMTGHSVGYNNQLLSDGTYDYTYDDEGNRLTKTKISNGDKEEYTWDHRNRLTTITFKNSGGTVVKTVDQSYDVFNQWIRRSLDPDGPGSAVAVDSFFSHEDRQIVLDFDGPAAADLTHRYTWGPAVDQLLADEAVTSLTSAGSVLWTLGDHLGTLRDLATYNTGTDDTAIANHRKYDSYGKLISEANAAGDEIFGFTGRALDETTGLQNNLNRWYDANIGLWLSEDPIGFGGKDTNLFRYVHS